MFLRDDLSKKIIKKMIYFPIVLAVALILQVVCNMNALSDKYIFDAFAKSDARDNKIYLNINGVYNGGYLDNKQLEDMKQYICASTNIHNEDCVIARQDDKFYIDLNVCFEADNIIEASEAFFKKKDEIIKLLESMNFKVDFYITITGCVEGKMNDSYRELVSDKILKVLGIENSQMNYLTKDELDCICYGFSGRLLSSQEIAGQLVNVSLAYTYDEIQDKTIIYLATPYITSCF